MVAECVDRKCSHCGYTLQSRDCKRIIVGNLTASPVDDRHVIHCICYQCGEEWVE